MPKEKQVKDDRRAAIIHAAYSLFGKVGYLKATMKDIAAEAGVAQGLIGYHFRTKEALLVEVVREWMINRGMKESLAGMSFTTDPSEITALALKHIAQFRKENPEWFTLLVSLWLESLRNEALANELQDIYKEMKLGIIEVLDRLGLEMETEEKEALASVVQAIFDGLTLQHLSNQGNHELYSSHMSIGIHWILNSIRIGKEPNQ